MRRRHFEELKPVCPVCLHQRGETVLLRLAAVERERSEVVFEGVLHCSAAACLREYPIVDGVPLLVMDLRSYITNNLLALTQRTDLSEIVESILGDCCGPNSAFDAARLYLSSYAWDHYGDLDPAEAEGTPRPGSVVRVLGGLLGLAGELTGPMLDVGCAVGRGSFALAESEPDLVLGVDVNATMLRAASQVLHDGRVQYPRKRIGIVYDRRAVDVAFTQSECVDFWACDIQALPFAAGTFGAATALNVLDCVPSPRDALAGLRRVLRDGGKALLTTPYDWSPTATPLEAWIGGHSQRGDNKGAAEPLLRALLTPGAHPQAVEGLKIVAETPDVPWHVRIHDRSCMEYKVHAIVARATN